MEKEYKIVLRNDDEKGINLTYYEASDGLFKDNKPVFGQDFEIINNLKGLTKKLNLKGLNASLSIK